MKDNRLTFDAGILSLYYAGDENVRPYFADVSSRVKAGFMSEVNLAEFYYKSAEKYALDTVETWYMLTRRSRMIIVSPDEDITRQAARLKIKYRSKLSLADCFAISTSMNNRSTLITTDIRIKEVKEIDIIHIKFNHGKC